MSLFNSLFHSCRKAAELIDRDAVAPLNGLERVRLGVHLSVCAGCRAFKQQGRVIDELMESRLAQAPQGTDVLEARILSQLKG